MAERPLIGVTGPDRNGGFAWLFTRLAVYRAGGKAHRITPSRPCSVEVLDGLILGGGADVDPARYGEEPQRSGPAPRKTLADHLLRFIRRDPKASVSGTWIDEDRDRLEFGLLTNARAKGLPVLGICRGSQVLAVSTGGKLIQNILSRYTWPPYVRTLSPRKRVHLVRNSRLHRILRTTTCLVNALHFQAVDSPGKELSVVARESNEIVQGIECPRSPFLIGVQWHPEYMPQVSRQQALFRALVTAARTRH